MRPDAALALARDDDGQAVFSAQPITGPAYLIEVTLVGMVVFVVGEVEIVVNMSLINMGGKYKLVLATHYFFCNLHSDFIAFFG